jgi:hypothetical protein
MAYEYRIESTTASHALRACVYVHVHTRKEQVRGKIGWRFHRRALPPKQAPAAPSNSSRACTEQAQSPVSP